MPEDPGLFEFDDPGEMDAFPYDDSYNESVPDHALDFTGFSDTKIKSGTALDIQLNKELKRMLYSRHNSGREFYKDEDTASSELVDD